MGCGPSQPADTGCTGGDAKPVPAPPCEPPKPAPAPAPAPPPPPPPAPAPAPEESGDAAKYNPIIADSLNAIKALFEKLDADGDGSLDKSELKEVVSKYNGETFDEAQFFGWFDVHGVSAGHKSVPAACTHTLPLCTCNRATLL